MEYDQVKYWNLILGVMVGGCEFGRRLLGGMALLKA
jgi:hypothetical protein